MRFETVCTTYCAFKLDVRLVLNENLGVAKCLKGDSLLLSKC
jgi:hypothetical protein